MSFCFVLFVVSHPKADEKEDLPNEPAQKLAWSVQRTFGILSKAQYRLSLRVQRSLHELGLNGLVYSGALVSFLDWVRHGPQYGRRGDCRLMRLVRPLFLDSNEMEGNGRHGHAGAVPAAGGLVSRPVQRAGQRIDEPARRQRLSRHRSDQEGHRGHPDGVGNRRSFTAAGRGQLDQPHPQGARQRPAIGYQLLRQPQSGSFVVGTPLPCRSPVSHFELSDWRRQVFSLRDLIERANFFLGDFLLIKSTLKADKESADLQAKVMPRR